MNSMHGYWMAMARLATDHWFAPSWWPYWDGGIPFEFAYAPLVPAATVLWSKLAGVEVPRAFHSVSAVIYILAPLTLFLAARALSGRTLDSFAAALLYSLTAVTELIDPDQSFTWSNLGNARRLYLQFIWDETPHLAALAFLPLSVLFLARSFETARPLYYLLTIFSMVLVVLSNAFGATMILIAVVCLLLAHPARNLLRHLAITAGTGMVSYAIVCPWLPPQLLQAISHAGKVNDERVWSAGSLTVLGLLVIGLTAIHRYLAARGLPWTYLFCVYATFFTGLVVAAAEYLNRYLLPQPGRYKMELEMSLCLLVAFSAAFLLRKLPSAFRAGLAILLVALVSEQIISHRKFAKQVIRSVDIRQTIEYKLSNWVAQNMPGERVMLPGSLGQWNNTFADTLQYSGGSWSTAYNPVQQIGLGEIFSTPAATEQKSHNALLWMKAYGVQAIAVPGPKSPEFWKAVSQPEKFSDLALLWAESDTSLRRVPQRSKSLAHVVPASAIVRTRPRSGAELGEIRRFVSALDSPELPLAQFEWRGTDSAVVRGALQPGDQRVSVQVNYHAGWKATQDGRPLSVEPDGLGLMVLAPAPGKSFNIALTYDGGTVTRLLRTVSFLTSGAVLLVAVVLAIRRRVLDSQPAIRSGTGD